MKVTYTVRALALVRVFSELHVHVGGRLYMDDLRQEWRRITGLRQSDLRLALQEMAQREEIVIHEADAETLVELTQAGIDHVLGGHTQFSSFIDRLRARMVLARTARRSTGFRIGALPELLGRRVTDNRPYA
ncbi:hypothetical protein [Algiphilus sp.]|uniref:hypothetical protein n=1 Tax=Algiphilus sp. TaxID=1872431 RepID=UPI0025BF3951|nr:hypothetical protein [Algiphilus sp.]MCK5769137.1 hypothetical protein [Algiphilus sp.]